MSADIKKELADEAVRIVTGARRAAYGKPEDNFARIARLQAAYMASRAEPDAEIRPIDVAFLNLMQKVARICESPTHRDSFTDAVGYVLCAAEVAGVAVTEGPKGHSAEQAIRAALGGEPKFKVGDKLRWLGKFNAEMYTTGSVYEVKWRRGEAEFGVTDDRQDTGAHSWSADKIAECFSVVAPEPAPLQIEAGKFYRTRDGRKVGPLAYRPGGEWIWRAGMEDWRADGSWAPRRGDTDVCDLVAEWVEP